MRFRPFSFSKTVFLPSHCFKFPTTLPSYRFYPALPKRFYRKVDVVNNGYNSYEITLDNKKLKTPNNNILVVENKTLALAVASEWGSQENEIQRSSMHLTSLCNTVIDNPLNVGRDALVRTLLNFLFTDVLIYLSEDGNDLRQIQEREWIPVIDKFNKKYSINVSPITDLSVSFIDDTSWDGLRRHLLSYNLACLHGLTFAAESMKSLILTMCCVEQELSVEQAVFLSRLEEEFQIQHWGRIEWAHDTNHADILSRVSAAILFTRLNMESSIVRSK